MKRKTLSPEARAAIIAAGGNPDAEVNTTAAEVGAGSGGAAAETGAEGSAAAPAAEAGAVAAPAAEAGAAAAAAAPEAVKPAEGEVVAFLRGELREAQAKITDLTMENKTATDKVAAMESTHNALASIAAGAVNNMRVALGLSKIADGTQAEQLVTEHSTRLAEFQVKFPVGGVSAAVTVDKQAEATTGKVNESQYAGIVNATRFQQTKKGK